MTAFSPPCHHGGEFFDAIGDEFVPLQWRHEMIGADVLDAWFPSPKVIAALMRALLWLLRISSRAHRQGLAHHRPQVEKPGGQHPPGRGFIRFDFSRALPVAQAGVAPLDFRSRLRRIRARFGTRHRLPRHALALACDLNRGYEATIWLLGDPIRPDFSLCISEGQKLSAKMTKITEP